MPNRRLYPMPEAMEYLGGITRPTIYGLINRGEIQRVKIGRRAFITIESLEKYVAERVTESNKAGA